MKKKRILAMSIFIGFFILLFISIEAINAPAPVTVFYDDITLPSSYATFWQPENWNLNLGPVILSYTLDLAYAPNVAYDWNWDRMGLVGLINPGTDWSGARMAGYLSDWENRLLQFPSYPDRPGKWDLDDKFNLQKFPFPGSWDEGMYDVEFKTSPVVYTNPFGSGKNSGIWFDRDGVDQWQAAMWGMVDGGTYNSLGIYPVLLTFSKDPSGKGLVYPRLFPDLNNTWDLYTGKGIGTGFYYPNWHSSEPTYYPTGLSFDSDSIKMSKMRVYIAGSSGPDQGTIIVKNIKVTGFLGTLVIDGCDTGVVDKVLGDGTTISGLIQQCASTATNHGQFVSCVADLTNSLMKAGYITGKEKGIIQNCAGKANIPPK